MDRPVDRHALAQGWAQAARFAGDVCLQQLSELASRAPKWSCAAFIAASLLAVLVVVALLWFPAPSSAAGPTSSTSTTTTGLAVIVNSSGGHEDANWKATSIPALQPTFTTATTTTTTTAEGGAAGAFCSADAEEAASRSDGLDDRVWRIHEDYSRGCFEKIGAVAPKMVLGMDALERNWCWVGLKEAGCHRHLLERSSWYDLRRYALWEQDGVTINLPFEPLVDPGLCDRTELGEAPESWSDAEGQKARSWFEDNVKVFVLSLPESERSSHIQERLNALNIPFEFVWGLDMREEGAYAQAVEQGLIPERFDYAKAQAEAEAPRNSMGNIMGTLGCAAGHFRAQQAALDSHVVSPLAVVLEDDVVVTEDFVTRLWSLVTEELPCDWQVTSLFSRCPFGKCVSPHLTLVQPDVNEPEWSCRHGVNYGMQGMLYRLSDLEEVRRIWVPTVFDEERPHCLDVDVALASISDRVRYYAVPAAQEPGFLAESGEGSTRIGINEEVQAALEASPQLLQGTQLRR